MFELDRSEWVAIALMVAAIAAINKLVIQDHRNDWAGLILVAFFASRGVIQLARWARRRAAARPSTS